MNKVLVKIYFPLIEEKHDIWIPTNKTVYSVIALLLKTVEGLKDIQYTPSLYNKYTGVCYDMNMEIKQADIKNGTELIII